MINKAHSLLLFTITFNTPQMKHFEASIREALSKLQDTEQSEDEEILVRRVEELVKTHLATAADLEKREEELAATRKGAWLLKL